jgi:hypothetical protein
MKIILLVIGIVFVVNSNFAFAKNMYFDCNSKGNFKYSKSWFGKGKLFWEKDAEWVRDDDVEITDDKLISPNWEYGDSSWCNRFGPCKYKKVISLVLRNKVSNNPWVMLHRIVTSKQCSWSDGECFVLHAGDAMPESSCQVIEQ